MPTADLPARLAKAAAGWLAAESFPDELGEAAAYARRMHQRPLAYYVRRLRALGLGGGRALDAGCGTGTWSIALADRFQAIDGIDLHPRRVEQARHLATRFELPALRFAVGDVTRLPFPDAQFDAVFCYGVLLAISDLTATLAELRRVLVPGGVVYACLNGIGWSYFLRDGRGATNARDRELGCGAIYHHLCRHHLGQVRDQLVGAARELRGRRPRGRRPSAAALLTALAAHGRVRRVAELVRTECGAGYGRRLMRDLWELAAGRREEFSLAECGRAYAPEEVRAAAAAAGLCGFQWAGEGLLRGEVNEEEVSPIYDQLFDGQLSVWELVAFKPQADLGETLGPTWFTRQAELARELPLCAPAHRPLAFSADAESLPSSRVAEARRLAAAAGGERLIHRLAAELTQGCETPEAAAIALTSFVQAALHRHPLAQAMAGNGEALLDPAALLFVHVGRCGAASSLLVALLRAAGIRATIWQLPAHQVVLAELDGREVVLDADLLKGGTMMRGADGRLLTRVELLAAPERIDVYPTMTGYFALAPGAARDLWGRSVLGYHEAHLDRVRRLSSYYREVEPGRRYLPMVSMVQVRRAGAGWRCAWTVHDRGGARPQFVVTVGRATRGWSYEGAPQAASVYRRAPSPAETSVITREPELEWAAQSDGPWFVEVRPQLGAEPEVFCWPSAELVVSAGELEPA